MDSNLKALLNQAIDALDNVPSVGEPYSQQTANDQTRARIALRAALAKPELAQDLTDIQALRLGLQVSHLLNLRLKAGRVNTAWGTKTPIGLGHCISRLQAETAEPMTDAEFETYAKEQSK